MSRVSAISSEIQDTLPKFIIVISLRVPSFSRHFPPDGRFPSLGRDSSRSPQGQLEFGAELEGSFSRSGLEVSEVDGPNLVIGE